MRYNPFARNFYRLRRTLIETLDLPRHSIRPTSTFVELIPPADRRHVQERIHLEFGHILDLHFSSIQWAVMLLVLIVSFGLGYFALPWLSLLVASNVCIAIPGVIVLGTGVAYTAFRLIRLEPTEFDAQETIADVVIRMTSVQHCRDAEYRLTQHDIFLKVRGIIAHSLLVNKNTITPETKWFDLSDC